MYQQFQNRPQRKKVSLFLSGLAPAGRDVGRHKLWPADHLLDHRPHIPQIFERMTDVRHLPIEHGCDLIILGQHIVQQRIVVHDRLSRVNTTDVGAHPRQRRTDRHRRRMRHALPLLFQGNGVGQPGLSFGGIDIPHHDFLKITDRHTMHQRKLPRETCSQRGGLGRRTPIIHRRHRRLAGQLFSDQEGGAQWCRRFLKQHRARHLHARSVHALQYGELHAWSRQGGKGARMFALQHQSRRYDRRAFDDK